MITYVFLDQKRVNLCLKKFEVGYIHEQDKNTQKEDKKFGNTEETM